MTGHGSDSEPQASDSSSTPGRDSAGASPRLASSSGGRLHTVLYEQSIQCRKCPRDADRRQHSAFQSEIAEKRLQYLRHSGQTLLCNQGLDMPIYPLVLLQRRTASPCAADGGTVMSRPCCPIWGLEWARHPPSSGTALQPWGSQEPRARGPAARTKPPQHIRGLPADLPSCLWPDIRTPRPLNRCSSHTHATTTPTPTPIEPRPTFAGPRSRSHAHTQPSSCSSTPMPDFCRQHH